MLIATRKTVELAREVKAALDRGGYVDGRLDGFPLPALRSPRYVLVRIFSDAPEVGAAILSGRYDSVAEAAAVARIDLGNLRRNRVLRGVR